jgi:RNA polymerase sigma factor (sigma-70 family)
MTTQLAQTQWQSLNTLFATGALGVMTDPELLKRFRTDQGAGGQEAFRVLVERHGPMVLGVCRSLISDPHEAEDAFQATFLVLVRKGHAIWVRDSVGPWLYGVASRVARRARRRAIRRQKCQVGIVEDVADVRSPGPAIRTDELETQAAIHHEVAGLPVRLRDPVVLCAFEGLTYEAAARRLGVPEPTLRGRLGRARRRLATRLRERGIASAVTSLASRGAIEPFTLSTVPVPTALVTSTVQNSVWWSSVRGLVGAEHVIPASIAALARGVLRSMVVSTFHLVAIASLVAAGVLASVVSAQQGTAAKVASTAKPRTSPAARPVDPGAAPARGPAAPPAQPVPRVITGRVTDRQGRPVREGRVMLAPQNVAMPFEEPGMAKIDSDGRFRIELSGLPFGSETLAATDALRYLVLAPGFRSEIGNVAAGAGPANLDVRLTSEPWTTTEIRLVDRAGKPVSGAEVSLHMAGPDDWARKMSDAAGRCQIESAPGQGFEVTVQRDGYLTTRFGSRATADDPKIFTVPLYSAIQGRVVDPDRKPLPGIQVGRLIAPNYDAGLDKPSDGLEMAPPLGSKHPVITDADGRFKLTPRINLDRRSGEFKSWPIAVCFADQSLRRLHFLRVDLQTQKQEYEITLRPGRHVRIPVEHEVTVASGVLNSWWELSDLAGSSGPDQGVFVMQGLVKRNGPGRGADSGDWIDAFWPEGKYRIKVNSADPVAHEGAEETQTDVDVPSGDGPLTLWPIRMKVLPQRGLIGQLAPELDAKDLHTGAAVKLADYRGKVVVLDFWGYWCGPCIGAMPALIEAHDRYKGKPVAIIALHDQSIQSRDAYDRKLTEVRRQAWKDRELPFVVALDRPNPALAAGDAGIGNGVTCKRYEIAFFPTTLVIDQEGKVAGIVNVREEGRLEAMLNDLLEKSTQK